MDGLKRPVRREIKIYGAAPKTLVDFHTGDGRRTCTPREEGGPATGRYFWCPRHGDVMYDAPAAANSSIWTSTISLPQVSWTSMGASRAARLSPS